MVPQSMLTSRSSSIYCLLINPVLALRTELLWVLVNKPLSNNKRLSRMSRVSSDGSFCVSCAASPVSKYLPHYFTTKLSRGRRIYFGGMF